MNDNLYGRISSFALANLPPCPTLEGHTIALIREALPILISRDNLSNAAEMLASKLDMLDSNIPQVFNDFQINEHDSTFISSLQLTAISYIVTLVANNYGHSIEGIAKRLDKIEKASLKLKKLLDFDQEFSVISGSLFLSEFWEIPYDFQSGANVPDDWSKNLLALRYENLCKELEFLTTIRHFFSQSIIAKMLRFGESGPKEDIALNEWVSGLAEIWVTHLNRSLRQSTDPKSGRENFLSFAEGCFIEIHPTLTIERPDALRNTYEKLRSLGKFNYLHEKEDRLV